MTAFPATATHKAQNPTAAKRSGSCEGSAGAGTEIVGADKRP
jgi:hypothetical protein